MTSNYAEEVINIEDTDGSVIHCVFNYINEEDRPLIVIPSQYEKTIRTNLMLMLYLVNNGFNVLRYDNRNHNGNSTGKILDFTLKSAIEDLSIVMNYVQRELSYTKEQLGIVGISISNKVVMEYLKKIENRVSVYVSLVGVVNMQHTLEAIAGFDAVKEKKSDKEHILGVHKLLSYEIDWDNFVTDMLELKLEDVNSSLEAVEQIDIPVYAIVAEKDNWVNMDEVDIVLKRCIHVKGKHVLQGATHELYKNPESAKTAMRQILLNVREHWNMGSSSLVLPDIMDMIAHNKEERQREKLYMREE